MPDLKSNTEWKLWGKDDPLWGVASWENKQRGGNSPWTAESFYALGESDWLDFSAHWQDYGVDRRSCLEIGCGAGRITRQLAKWFEFVYAVDVSEDMITCARDGINRQNVEFAITDGLHLPNSNCSMKAIFSTHVLQHLDTVDLGFLYLRECFRVLDTGGTMMVHLPLYQFPNAEAGLVGRLMRDMYALSRRLGNMRAEVKRRAGVKTMRGTPYPIQPLHDFLCGLGFKNVQFRIFPTKSNLHLHPFVFATK